MASVSWDYPRDRMLALQRQTQAANAATPLDTGLALEHPRFRYAISGGNLPWKPLRAFDDGQKVYIQFPASIAPMTNCRRYSSSAQKATGNW